MTIEEIMQNLQAISVFGVFKVFILLALIVYFFFSLVVLRQVQIMTKTFETGFELVLKTIAWTHLLLVVGIFIVVLFFL